MPNEIDPHALIRVFIAQFSLERERLGYTQGDVGVYVGHEHSLVSAWERGVTEPRLAAFIRWADGLDYDIALVKRKKRGESEGDE